MGDIVSLKLKISNLASFECSGDSEFVAKERKEFLTALNGLSGEHNLKMQHTNGINSLAQNCSLRQIKETKMVLSDLLSAIQDGRLQLEMGDIIDITLLDGTTDQFVMTQEDDEAYRFESVNCILGECITRDEADSAFEKYYDLLPKKLRDEMLLTKRQYLNENGNKRECEELLFLPSAPEVFPPDDVYGDNGLYEQMEWYKDRRHRIRKLTKDSDTTVCWWLISAYAGTASDFCYVNNNGGASGNIASAAWVGLPVCFRIRKSK